MWYILIIQIKYIVIVLKLSWPISLLNYLLNTKTKRHEDKSILEVSKLVIHDLSLFNYLFIIYIYIYIYIYKNLISIIIWKGYENTLVWFGSLVFLQYTKSIFPTI
jgi:hypothetical protein